MGVEQPWKFLEDDADALMEHKGGGQLRHQAENF